MQKTMYRKNNFVVWLSIVTFCGVMLGLAMLSGLDSDWANAQYTIPLVLPLVLILVVNRLVGPAPSGERMTPTILLFRIAPTVAQRSDPGADSTSDQRIRRHRLKLFRGRS